MKNRNRENKKKLRPTAAAKGESFSLCPVPTANSMLSSRLLTQHVDASFVACLRSCLQRIRGFFSRVFKQRGRQRKLQLLEIQQLGEKRFVAIVRVGKQKFLIGGAASSVSLLAEIGTQRATVIAARPLSEESA